MSNTTDRPGNPYRAFLGAAVVVLLGLLLTAGLKSYRDLARAQDHEADLVHRIHSTEQRIEGLQQRVDRLQDDPSTLERLAREDLGMVAPGDLVVVLPVDDPETPDGGRIASGEGP